MTKDSEAAIGVAILTGGLSSRMGKAKENLTLSKNDISVTFLNYLCNEMNDFCCKYISESDSQNHSVEGYICVKDKYKELGPLGGIYSVLMECSTQAVLFIACDMPNFTKKAAMYLINHWDRSLACVALVDGKRQPFAGIYTKACIPYIEKMIESGIYKIGVLLENTHCQMIDMTQFKDNFININTQADYLEFSSTQKF